MVLGARDIAVSSTLSYSLWSLVISVINRWSRIMHQQKSRTVKWINHDTAINAVDTTYTI